MPNIYLETPQQVEEFVNAAAKCECDVNLKSGVVYIDGKSLLGVLCMGLKRELEISATKPHPQLKRIAKKFAAA